MPIRAVIEAVGGTVKWDASTPKVTIVQRGKTLELWLGKNTAKLDGKSVKVDSNPKVTPIIVNGRTLPPLRFVVESLTMEVAWNISTNEAIITCKP